MRRPVGRTVTALAFILSTTATFPAAGKPATAPTDVAIEEVLKEVQTALALAQTQLADDDFPPLASVELTLQTLLTKRGGPKLKLFIFSFGRTWEKQRSQELVLTLTPPKPYTPKEIAERPHLSDQLVDAIVSAAEGVQNARGGSPPLELASFTAEISFVVTGGTQATASFQILPVSVDLSGDLTKSATHKIKVTFMAHK